LAVVNGEAQPGKATFQFAKSIVRVQAELGSQEIKHSGNSITLNLAPLEVRVIKAEF
jgi:hypothetical protein